MAGLACLREAAGHVIGVRRALKVLQVARNASGAGQVVIAVYVAVSALSRRHGMSARQYEIDHRVIEGRRGPRDDGVTLRASSRKLCRNVIRIRCALIILEMASDASCARQVEGVVRMTVTTLARRHCMASAQWKPNGVVIKSGIEPVVRTVAGVAGRGEASGHVARGVGRLEVRGVARVALRGHRLKLAIGCAFVTGITIDGCVRPSERKPVIVLLDLLDRHLPPANSVTLLTIRSQLPLMNIGVAILAALAHVGEDGFHMALNACNRLMHAT